SYDCPTQGRRAVPLPPASWGVRETWPGCKGVTGADLRHELCLLFDQKQRTLKALERSSIPMFETLEKRQLLSSTPLKLTPVTLKVEGTSAADMIFINEADGQITVTKNGVDSTYASFLVKDIEVNAKAGDDSVWTYGAVTKSVKLVGGLGSDYLFG